VISKRAGKGAEMPRTPQDKILGKLGRYLQTGASATDKARHVELVGRILKKKQFQKEFLSRSRFQEICDECGGSVMERCDVDSKGRIKSSTCFWVCVGGAPSCDIFNDVYRSR
jgi:hypothetical protein